MLTIHSTAYDDGQNNIQLWRVIFGPKRLQNFPFLDVISITATTWELDFIRRNITNLPSACTETETYYGDMAKYVLNALANFNQSWYDVFIDMNNGLPEKD